ncbi:alpha/beta hydrolase [Actinophytocola sp.]|uniref:alpha/beta hydrolase n=1 Tax=Actinophytocola sp. TaxID=1872138 RepID=UPI00389A33B1
MSRYTDFPGPQELRTRGTVLVVPGRGETRTTYTRLATRLAGDAYHVRVVDPPELDAPGEFADGLAHAAALPRPLVLLGADSGAAVIAALVAREDPTAPWWPDAVVLAGLPGHAAGVTAGWEEELDVRTSCPVHRGVLTSDTAVGRGALATPVPDGLLAAAYESTTALPRLVLVGDADPLADREALARAVKSAPRARLSVVRGAHHDVLNDRQHRSVAAEIVSFLETLGNELVPVIEVESSAW